MDGDQDDKGALAVKFRRLGRTELNVSVVGIGAWQFGGDWGKTFTQAEVDAILDQAEELGINLIDTAECYGPDHRSERLIGDYLKRRQSRSRWIVATKFGHVYQDPVRAAEPAWSAQKVLEQLEASLRALQTDHVDLYQFHSGRDEFFDNDELWTALDGVVRAAKARNLGISIGSNDNLHQTDAATRVNARAIQVVYNRLDPTAERRVLPSCQRQDLGVLARVPLASGYLSGKYAPGATFPDNDVRSRRDRDQEEAKLRQVEEIRRTEVPPGVNMAQWALAWCLAHPAVTCVIPGCKDPDQVKVNAAAADLELAPR